MATVGKRLGKRLINFNKITPDKKTQNLGVWTVVDDDGYIEMRVASTERADYDKELNNKMPGFRKGKNVDIVGVINAQRELTAKYLVTGVRFKEFLYEETLDDKGAPVLDASGSPELNPVMDNEGEPAFKWVDGIPTPDGDTLPVTEANVKKFFSDYPSAYAKVSGQANDEAAYTKAAVEETKNKSS